MQLWRESINNKHKKFPLSQIYLEYWLLPWQKRKIDQFIDDKNKATYENLMNTRKIKKPKYTDEAQKSKNLDDAQKTTLQLDL